jgi:hypothetical protein
VLVAALGWAERSAIAHPDALSSSRALGLPQVDDLLAESVAARLEIVEMPDPRGEDLHAVLPSVGCTENLSTGVVVMKSAQDGA